MIRRSILPLERSIVSGRDGATGARASSRRLAAALLIPNMIGLVGCFGAFPEWRAPPTADAGLTDAEPDASPSRDMAPDVQLDVSLSPELCNGADDDSDGRVDEGFALRMVCTAGEGACAAEGQTICRPDGMGTACDAAPGAPGIERCNSQDDDCDGVVDGGLIRSCSIESVGVCVAGRQICEAGAWSPCEGDVEPTLGDLCDGLDSDCDAIVDEDILPDGAWPCGECEPIAAECEPSTACVEQCDPGSMVRFACAPAPEVDCDGRDDDCDGVIDDDGVCGREIAETCTFGLGWTTEAVASPTAEWGDCSIEDGEVGDGFSCNETRARQFRTVNLPGGVDLDAVDDALGVALRCRAGSVGDYIVDHCRVVLGVATSAAAVIDGAERWGGCPERRNDGDDQRACTSTTADGGFLPMPLPFDLGADAVMGVAFICDDPADPERARALQSSVAVSLGWADGSIAGEIDWAWACALLGDGEPFTACATTRGDGRFRVFRLTADVDGGDRFAIALRPL